MRWWPCRWWYAQAEESIRPEPAVESTGLFGLERMQLELQNPWLAGLTPVQITGENHNLRMFICAKASYRSIPGPPVGPF